jgi:transcriptional regulator with XRE-family HTH domain
MARKWSDLREKMLPEARARADHKTEVMLITIALRDLLAERGFTQEQLAEELERAQGNVSRMLRRTDMHVSTLQEIIEAMGGSMEITAVFPDASYKIEQLAPTPSH